jgi:hypothetical protein
VKLLEWKIDKVMINNGDSNSNFTEKDLFIGKKTFTIGENSSNEKKKSP